MVDGNNLDEEKIYKIGVVSGKGGVGKSTITAALASLLVKDGKRFIAVDLDVDAPNLALFFEFEAENFTTVPVETTEKAYFIEENCIHCRSCIDDEFCVYKAIRWDQEKDIPILDRLACEGCGSCEVLCESKAFGIKPIESGYIYTGLTKEGFKLVYGETIIGATTSGKTVVETKDLAKKNAKDGESLMLADGPPGIGCPVIAMLSGLNYVIVVVEPFPAAIHDANRVIQVIENFEIPFGIVVNKFDVWKEGYDMIVRYIAENHYTHVGNVPIDMNVPKSVMNMQSIIKFAPQSPAARSIEKIYEKLKMLTGI
ncbi:MAG: P-loop NTPase [Promethearchaeota archaeon]